MNARHRIVAVALTATVPLALAACGNPNDTHAKASVKAWTLSSLKSNDGSLKLTDAQGGCFANNVVDKVGVKQLKADKFLDEKSNVITSAVGSLKLPQADATKFADAIVSCTNNGAPFITAIETVLDAGASAATKSCIDSKITADLMRKFMLAGFSGASNPTGVLQTAVAPCSSTGH